MASEGPTLTREQSAALFDILTHKAVYDEICQFKSAQAIQEYGAPFQLDQQQPGNMSSPLLQDLLCKFVLTLPGLRDVSAADFWQIRVQEIIKALADADLSESYDKGVLGMRKTVATAISALIEYPARGCVGGLTKDDDALKAKDYNPNDPEDVLLAFHDFIQQIVYGDLLNTIFEQTAKSEDLSQQSTLVQSAHEFILVNLASFMHYALVLSPEGASLLRLAEHVHKLTPYLLIRQTVKVGNVATMINGMVRLLLAKLSVASVTNWIGWSKNADEGMNLLQSIISTVLHWDKRDLRKRVEKIEKDSDSPTKEVRTVLDDWVNAGREVHIETRARSQDLSMSLVAVIMSLSSVSDEMTDAQHENAAEYLALQLGMRDRKEIVQVLCHSNPDHLTQAIRDGVAAYEPVIRQVHEAVDLSQTVQDFENFANDLFKMSKPGKDERSPSVEDYVKLLHDHMLSLHRFLHQVAKNGTQVTGWFKEYAVNASKHFQKEQSPDTPSIQTRIENIFDGVSVGDQKQIRDELDDYQRYLSALHEASSARIRDVIANQSSTAYGPGAYLARWQELLDATAIAPKEAKGPVRHGSDLVVASQSVTQTGEPPVTVTAEQTENGEYIGNGTPDAPAMDLTLRLLGPKFRDILLERMTVAPVLPV